jgi:hypothetical protein
MFSPRLFGNGKDGFGGIKKSTLLNSYLLVALLLDIIKRRKIVGIIGIRDILIRSGRKYLGRIKYRRNTGLARREV